MGAPLRLTPTAQGQKILDLILKLHGSIQAAARAANMNEHTLRRRIYRTPSRIDLRTTERLEAIGIPRRLLAS